MTGRAWFRCMNECSVRDPAYRSRLHLPRVRGAAARPARLEALRHRSPAAWMKLFDERYKRTTWPYGSGVWGKKEWVAPQRRRRQRRLAGRGRHQPVLGRALRQASSAWTTSGSSMCGNSHTGSFKDLGMTVLVSCVKQMIADGKPIQAVACASTGDTSAALAAYCAVAGHPGRRAPAARQGLRRRSWSSRSPTARWCSRSTPTSTAAWRSCSSWPSEPGIYLANSMNSLRVEGQKTVGIEIVQQFDWEVPDWVIIPGGNLGNVAALGAGFQMMHDLGLIQKLPRIVRGPGRARQPALPGLHARASTSSSRSRPSRPWPPPSRSATRSATSGRSARSRQFDGVVEQATEDELAEAAARADRTGMFTDPHTGVALAALEKLVARGEIVSSTSAVVVISTANGLKFTDFKVALPRGQLEAIGSRHANRPVLLPAEYEQVKRTVLGKVG